MSSLINTSKVYYNNPYATRCSTTWTRRSSTTLALNESVAFPEGGGQLGDIGIVRQRETILQFVDTQKIGGKPVVRTDFPSINVGGEVALTLSDPGLEAFDENETVEVVIDTQRRAELTRSHTAAHLIWVGMMQTIENLHGIVRGCYIEPSGGRFDLQIEELTDDQIMEIAAIAQEWQLANHEINMEALADEPECRFWICNNVRIPCGGTHLSCTGLVGSMGVQRRSKGKNLKRVYYTLSEPAPAALLALYENGVV